MIQPLTFWQQTAVSQQHLEPISLCEFQFLHCVELQLLVVEGFFLYIRKTHTRLYIFMGARIAVVSVMHQVHECLGGLLIPVPRHRGVLAATFTGLVLRVLLSCTELRVNLKVGFTSHERQKSISLCV